MKYGSNTTASKSPLRGVGGIINYLSARLHLHEGATWELYYETGLAYIEQLKCRIKYSEILRAQFGSMLSSGALKITPTETFRRIETSPLFWGWWAYELWGIYAMHKCPVSELRMRSMLATDLIPQNIITKILTNGIDIPQQSRQSRNLRHTAAECYSEY